MNLPNAITVGRIAMTPMIAWMPLTTSWTWRLVAFALFLVAAISDYWDGYFARTRNGVTDLGRVLDPLADKLLLIATLLPMYFLQHDNRFLVPIGNVVPEPSPFLFITPFGRVSLPLWIVLVVVGRELFMTVFRQLAQRRGLIISAIGPAKWKTTFQSIWTGSAFFWFFSATWALQAGVQENFKWRAFAMFNGLVGVLAMAGAVALTLWSLALYMQRYGRRVMHPMPMR